jgi:hypothetical protein
MTMYRTNGSGTAPGFETSPEVQPYAATELEDEWELPELAQPYAAQELEGEWESPESIHESQPYAATGLEGEWELPATGQPEHPYGGFELETEWETAAETHPYAATELPEDELFPTRVAIPRLMRAARRLTPLARSTMPSVVRIVIGVPAGGLLRQLGPLLRESEQEAAALEAHLFGANEMEAEVAAHETAHEAALTEVLAAESAHTESESEAEALLGAALPVTIRIMGGARALRPVLPTLARSNARLVRGLHQRGGAGRQLMRLVPSIQRRTVAGLRAAQRAGYPLTPALAARMMGAQTARVMGSPRLSGPALVRNAAIRRATVAPAGRPVRPRGGCGCGR